MAPTDCGKAFTGRSFRVSGAGFGQVADAERLLYETFMTGAPTPRDILGHVYNPADRVSFRSWPIAAHHGQRLSCRTTLGRSSTY